MKDPWVGIAAAVMAVITDEAEAVAAPGDAMGSVEALPLKTVAALEASVKTTPLEATVAETAVASTVVAAAAAEMAVASNAVATVAAATVVVEAIVEAAAMEATVEVVDKELLGAIMTATAADSETLGVITQPAGELLPHYAAPTI